MQKKQFILLLQKNLGNVSAACRDALPDNENMSENQKKHNQAKRETIRSVHYKRMQSDEDYKTAVEAIDNITLDFAEGKLMQLVNEMNPTAVIFFLKTKGKKRGYIEKIESEVYGKDGEPLQQSIIILPAKKPNE